MFEVEKNIRQEANLDEVPDQKFYFSDLTDTGRDAVKKIIGNPNQFFYNESWSLGAGDKYVPMIGVYVGDRTVQMDSRTEPGKTILENTLKKFKVLK